MDQLFANNAWSFLNGGINTVVTSIALTPGTGDRFPSPTGGKSFLLTLIGYDANAVENAWEIVKVTSRTGDSLTVERAQEGTSALTWASGTRVELRLTAGQASAFDGKLSVNEPDAAAARDLLGLGSLAVQDADTVNISGGTVNNTRVDFASAVAMVSAATTDIGAASSNVISLSGGTTITSFGTAEAGTIRILSIEDATLITTAAVVTFEDIQTQAGDMLVLLSEGGGTWRILSDRLLDGKARVAHTTNLSMPHTWAVAGEVKVPVGNTDVIPGFFIPLSSGNQNTYIASAYYQIGSGTSVTAKLQKNGVDITGYTNISITPTAAAVFTSVGPLNAGDYIQLIPTAVAGTPENLSFTLVLRYEVKGS